MSRIPLRLLMEKHKCNKQTAIKELILLGIFFLGVLGLGLGVHLSSQEWYGNTTLTASDEIPQIFQLGTVDFLWITLLGLSVLMLLTQAIQRPFMFLVIRNPLYRLNNNSRFMEDTLAKISQLIRLGGPFIALLLVHVLTGRTARGVQMNTTYLNSFVMSIPYGFCFRQIWQFPEQNLVILSIFYTMEKIFEGPLRSYAWFDINVALRLQFVTIILLRLYGTLNRLRTIFVFSYTSVSETKQRKLINYFLLGWNIATLPLLILLACLSSALSFPLFPLFTLPFFLVGFPRPLRFWSYPVGYSANHCSDTVYYQQLYPYVTKAFHSAVLAGKLGIVQPGEIYLLRWEDRFFWIQVLECDFIYLIYSCKGLELQETSCHTAEASRVDSIFSRALDLDSGYGCLNDFPLHSLMPLAKISAVGYSDTKNVLTGVLDSPDTLRIIQDYFLKTLLYFLLEHAYSGVKSPNTGLSRTPSSMSRLGSADLKTRKAFSSLPKAEKMIESSHLGTNTPKSNDSGSVKSHSGRGSRMAWVSDSKTHFGGGGKLESHRASLHHSSIVEEDKDNSGTVLVPVSWDSVESSSNNQCPVDDPNFSPVVECVRSKTSGRSQPPMSSKAKSYVLSDDNNSVAELVSNEIPYEDDFSDSETESTKDFFTKSLPKRPEKQEEEFSTPGSVRHKPAMRIVRRTSDKENKKPVYSGSLSASLAPPLTWVVDTPYDQEVLEDMQGSFPFSWFKFLLKHFGLRKMQHPPYRTDKDETAEDEKNRLIEILLQDEGLEESYRALVALCQLTVLGTDTSYPTPGQVLKIFSGEMVWSHGLDWIKKREQLFDLVLKSYRIAVKLSLDHSLVGPTNTSWVDLHASLEEYNSEWFVGPDQAEKSNADSVLGKPSSWNEAILQEMTSLFSLGYSDGKGVYTSHLLTLGEALINVGRLDQETVRAIWASLSGELLYLTNDDDERYSIQAHPVILRNLTIQAADPPLGYPIYSSPPTRMGLPWLCSH